jgi:hypothetical protein
MKQILIALALVVVASGCEIVVKDGEVPREYQSLAQRYMGTYSGTMDGNAGVLELKMEGNKAVATWKGAGGATVLDQCAAKIGQLLRVDVDEVGKGNYELDHATFALDTSMCSRKIQVPEIKLDFKHRETLQIKASVIEEIRQEWRCHTEMGELQTVFVPGDVTPQPDPRIPTPHPRTVCAWEDQYFFLYGRLKKQ